MVGPAVDLLFVVPEGPEVNFFLFLLRVQAPIEGAEKGLRVQAPFEGVEMGPEEGVEMGPEPEVDAPFEGVEMGPEPEVDAAFEGVEMGPKVDFFFLLPGQTRRVKRH